jgi:alpha-methylacyl-CoA racemase
MAGPLTGVRVLELPALGPVPFLGMLLADLGAEVVRIDRLPGASGLGDALAASQLGRGRRSVAIDLRKPGGAEVALRLAETCDVLIEGFRPGVAERLGIGPDVVLTRNPRLVYGRMTGWGQHGPLAPTAGHDITYLAITGLLHGIGPAAGPPIPPVNYVADFGGGAMFLATGLLAALLHARATGQGQVIDAAMTEGASYLGSMTRTFQARGGWKDEREANMIDGGSPNYRCYETADRKWVAVGALEPQFWSALLATLELDEATTPTPYAPDDWDACKKVLGDAFKAKTRDEWAVIFAPTESCVAPVLTLAEALEHPHNVARGSFVEVSGAPMPAPAPRFSATPATAGAVVDVGSATGDILSELGYDAAGIDELRASGAIGP